MEYNVSFTLLSLSCQGSRGLSCAWEKCMDPGHLTLGGGTIMGSLHVHWMTSHEYWYKVDQLI